MSQEDVEIVRQPIAVADQSRRRLEERLALRLPRAAAFLARAVWRLPRTSRLRCGLTRHFLRLTYDAVNRGDLEAQVALYHPEGETLLPSRLVAVGFDAVYHGREERIRLQRRWNDAWGKFRFEPEEWVDVGDDRVLVIGRVTGSGLSSGAGFDEPWAEVFTISGGRAIREQVLFDHVEALEAVGLRE